MSVMGKKLFGETPEESAQHVHLKQYSRIPMLLGKSIQIYKYSYTNPLFLG